MKKVYICSPLTGNIEENLNNVKQYTRYAIECGTAPVVSHFYALCLDDNIPKEGELGMKAGHSLIWICDECWVFGEEITAGMKSEIKLCKNLNIPVKFVEF